ncbi:MAG: hypothetical protein TYPL_3900 [Candidatus Tyloplasma litorale]|nr:MAG: hypothetical protein TYPL_3900 [Mycoplasmatales bacterium]
MLKKIILFSTILLISFFSIFFIFDISKNISEEGNFNSISNTSYDTNSNKDLDNSDSYINQKTALAQVESIDFFLNSRLDRAVTKYFRVNLSTSNFDLGDIGIHLAGHSGKISTSNSVDGMYLSYEKTENNTQVYFWLIGLSPETTYTIESAEVNGISTSINKSFTTDKEWTTEPSTPSAAKVNSIEMVDNQITDSTARIIVNLSTTNFEYSNIGIHLAGHSGKITTSNSVDGIGLDYIKTTNNKSVYFDITGLDPETTYTIESAEVNSTSTSLNVSFTTTKEPTKVESIEMVDELITDSTARIIVNLSSNDFDIDDIAIHLEGYDGGISTTNSVDGIGLEWISTHDDQTIYFDITGLSPETTYTIESAKVDSTSTNLNVSFTTTPDTSTKVESIEMVDELITDSTARIIVNLSSNDFDIDDIAIHLEGHDGGISTTNSVDGIGLEWISTHDDQTIYFDITGLSPETTYTIESAEVDSKSTELDVSFTTIEEVLTMVDTIELEDGYPTNETADIKVSYSSAEFDEDDLVLYFEGYDEGLTTSTPVDGITLTYDSTSSNKTEAYYTISGLEQGTQYTIETAEINDIETSIDLWFRTDMVEVEYIEVDDADDAITTSSVDINIIASQVEWWLHEDDLTLYLDGYAEGLTTSNPVDGISLEYNGRHNENTEIVTEWTISGLEAGTEYTIKSAEITSNITTVDYSFTTLEELAIVDNIELDTSLPSPTDSAIKIKVSYSSEYFDPNDLALQIAGVSGDLTTSTPVDGISLIYNSTSANKTEAYYTIEGLEEDTMYVITGEKINDVQTNITLSFKTEISKVESIEMVEDSITDSSVQIGVTVSSTSWWVNKSDLVIHLAGYDEGLSTTNPIGDISLTYDSVDGMEVYYTISGLEANTEYTIESAETTSNSTDINLSFTTLVSLAEVTTIEVIDGSITDSSVQIKVTTSTTEFDENDLVLHLEGHDGDLTTSNPVDGITLTHDSTNETEITYTISGLEANTEYTITSAKLNDIETTDINTIFTTSETPAEVTTIEVIDNSITDSSVQIKVTTSTTEFDENDLVLYLEGHDGDLTTSNPVDGITLTHDSTNETEITYTISGLESNTEYTITSAELNDVEITDINTTFTTLVSLAEVTTIEVIDNSITDSSVQIKVTTSTTEFDENDLVLHLEGHDGDLTTSNPVDEITLTHDSTNETEITYTISGLEANTEYTITSAKLNDVEITDINTTFTTLVSLAEVTTIEVIDNSITDSSVQIKVTTSTTEFDENDLVLHLEGHDGDLTTSNPVDEITLTHDSTNETEITYTISGLESDTEYTITSAKLNDVETENINLSFTTLISPAEVTTIEVIDGSITDSSVQIKVTTSTTEFDENDLVLHLEGHDGDLTTSNPVDEITLTHDSTNETEITYTISGLESDTEYTITTAKLNDIETTDINTIFTTSETPAEVTTIEVLDGSITDSSVMIGVNTSTTNFDPNDLVLHLEGHDGDLTTSNPIDGITLTNDGLLSETEIMYTISGLESDTEYTITTAKLNDIETTDINITFTTLEAPAEVSTIEVLHNSITDSSVQIKVTTSTTEFDENDLVLHLEGHDGDLTTSNPIDDGITLTHDSTNETEITYTISGLEAETKYTITGVKFNDNDDLYNTNTTFTTLEAPAKISTIEILYDSLTDSSVQIKVTTSKTNFNEDNLILHLANHDGDLTTSNPIDGITLTHDSTNETEIYYTISGLEAETTYTITYAKFNENDDWLTMNATFTTLEVPAIIDYIEIVDGSITDSSAQIKVVVTTTNFDENDLSIFLEGNTNGILTTSSSINGVKLIHDSTNGTEIYYTISGLDEESEYKISSAKLNSLEVEVDEAFQTLNSSLNIFILILIIIVIILLILMNYYLFRKLKK